MKLSTDRPYADPEKAARKLLEIASATEAAQDCRLYIEKINGPMLFKEGASPAVTKRASISRGRLVLHESGIFVKFTRPAANAARVTLFCPGQARSGTGRHRPAS
jgi:hypothetical protein